MDAIDNIIKVKFKKVNPQAMVPTYATSLSAAADLRACIGNGEKLVLASQEKRLIPTGIALELPFFLCAMILPRSGHAHKKSIFLGNGTGLIDPDYRGEVMVSLENRGHQDFIIKDGDRIAQLLITPYVQADFKETSEISQTARGSGGFGHTGSH